LMDTYRTFGCENGEPTFRYSLLDGVRDGFLVNPVVVDARTEITAELLSEKGYAVLTQNEEGVEQEESFIERIMNGSSSLTRPTGCFARRFWTTR